MNVIALSFGRRAGPTWFARLPLSRSHLAGSHLADPTWPEGRTYLVREARLDRVGEVQVRRALEHAEHVERLGTAPSSTRPPACTCGRCSAQSERQSATHSVAEGASERLQSALAWITHGSRMDHCAAVPAVKAVQCLKAAKACRTKAANAALTARPGYRSLKRGSACDPSRQASPQ